LELSGSCARNLSSGRCVSARTGSAPLAPGGRAETRCRSKQEIRAREFPPGRGQNGCWRGARASVVLRSARTYQRRGGIPCGRKGPRRQDRTRLATSLVRRGVVDESRRSGLGVLCHARPSGSADFARAAVAGKTRDRSRTVSRGEFLWPFWTDVLG